jgi:hypothetical protein
LKGRLHQARNVQTFPSQKRETYKAVTLKESLSECTAQQIDAWSFGSCSKGFQFQHVLMLKHLSGNIAPDHNIPRTFGEIFLLAPLFCSFN